MSVSWERWKKLRNNDPLVKSTLDSSSKLLCGIPLTPGCVKNEFWCQNAQNHPSSLLSIKLKLFCSVFGNIQVYSRVYANHKRTDAAEDELKCSSVRWVRSITISFQS